MSRPAVRCLIGLTIIGGWTGLVGRSLALSEISVPKSKPASQEKAAAPAAGKKDASDKKDDPGAKRDADESKSASAERATTKGLGGPDRYLTSVSTDKPIYKIGEMVYVRGVI